MVGPAEGEVHLWAAHLDEIDFDDLWIQCLSEAERDRAARFRFERDKVRFERRRCLLRLLLSRYLGIAPGAVELRYGPQGKPQLLEFGALQFNLSHSDGHALFGFAQTELGVDLERVRVDQDIDAVSRLVFAPEEKRVLESLPTSERIPAFFRGWTRKEAYVKARGQGLSLPLDSFEVSLAPDAQTHLVSSADDAAHWVFFDVAAFPEFTGCVAIREPCSRPDLRRITCLPE